MEHMDVDLSTQEKEQLESAARAQGLSLEDFIAQAVKQHFARQFESLKQRLNKPTFKRQWH